MLTRTPTYRDTPSLLTYEAYTIIILKYNFNQVFTKVESR